MNVLTLIKKKELKQQFTALHPDLQPNIFFEKGYISPINTDKSGESWYISGYFETPEGVETVELYRKTKGYLTSYQMYLALTDYGMPIQPSDLEEMARLQKSEGCQFMPENAFAFVEPTQRYLFNPSILPQEYEKAYEAFVQYQREQEEEERNLFYNEDDNGMLGDLQEQRKENKKEFNELVNEGVITEEEEEKSSRKKHKKSAPQNSTPEKEPETAFKNEEKDPYNSDWHEKYQRQDIALFDDGYFREGKQQITQITQSEYDDIVKRAAVADVFNSAVLTEEGIGKIADYCRNNKQTIEIPLKDGSMFSFKGGDGGFSVDYVRAYSDEVNYDVERAVATTVYSERYDEEKPGKDNTHSYGSKITQSYGSISNVYDIYSLSNDIRIDTTARGNEKLTLDERKIMLAVGAVDKNKAEEYINEYILAVNKYNERQRVFYESQLKEQEKFDFYEGNTPVKTTENRPVTENKDPYKSESDGTRSYGSKITRSDRPFATKPPEYDMGYVDDSLLGDKESLKEFREKQEKVTHDRVMSTLISESVYLGSYQKLEAAAAVSKYQSRQNNVKTDKGQVYVSSNAETYAAEGDHTDSSREKVVNSFKEKIRSFTIDRKPVQAHQIEETGRTEYNNTDGNEEIPYAGYAGRPYSQGESVFGKTENKGWDEKRLPVHGMPNYKTDGVPTAEAAPGKQTEKQPNRQIFTPVLGVKARPVNIKGTEVRNGFLFNREENESVIETNRPLFRGRNDEVILPNGTVNAGGGKDLYNDSGSFLSGIMNNTKASSRPIGTMAAVTNTASPVMRSYEKTAQQRKAIEKNAERRKDAGVNGFFRTEAPVRFYNNEKEDERQTGSAFQQTNSGTRISTAYRQANENIGNRPVYTSASNINRTNKTGGEKARQINNSVEKKVIPVNNRQNSQNSNERETVPLKQQKQNETVYFIHGKTVATVIKNGETVIANPAAAVKYIGTAGGLVIEDNGKVSPAMRRVVNATLQTGRVKGKYYYDNNGKIHHTVDTNVVRLARNSHKSQPEIIGKIKADGTVVTIRPTKSGSKSGTEHWGKGSPTTQAVAHASGKNRETAKIILDFSTEEEAQDYLDAQAAIDDLSTPERFSGINWNMLSERTMIKLRTLNPNGYTATGLKFLGVTSNYTVIGRGNQIARGRQLKRNVIEKWTTGIINPEKKINKHFSNVSRETKRVFKGTGLNVHLYSTYALKQALKTNSIKGVTLTEEQRTAVENQLAANSYAVEKMSALDFRDYIVSRDIKIDLDKFENETLNMDDKKDRAAVKRALLERRKELLTDLAVGGVSPNRLNSKENIRKEIKNQEKKLKAITKRTNEINSELQKVNEAISLYAVNKPLNEKSFQELKRLKRFKEKLLKEKKENRKKKERIIENRERLQELLNVDDTLNDIHTYETSTVSIQEQIVFYLRKLFNSTDAAIGLYWLREKMAIVSLILSAVNASVIQGLLSYAAKSPEFYGIAQAYIKLSDTKVEDIAKEAAHKLKEKANKAANRARQKVINKISKRDNINKVEKEKRLKNRKEKAQKRIAKRKKTVSKLKGFSERTMRKINVVVRIRDAISDPIEGLREFFREKVRRFIIKNLAAIIKGLVVATGFLSAALALVFTIIALWYTMQAPFLSFVSKVEALFASKPAYSLIEDRINLCNFLDSNLKYYMSGIAETEAASKSIMKTTGVSDELDIEYAIKNNGIIWKDINSDKSLKTLNPDEDKRRSVTMGRMVQGVRTGIYFRYFDGDGNRIPFKSNAKDIMSCANSWLSETSTAKGLYKSYVEKLWNYSHIFTYDAKPHGGKLIYPCPITEEDDCWDNTYTYKCTDKTAHVFEKKVTNDGEDEYVFIDSYKDRSRIRSKDPEDKTDQAYLDYDERGCERHNVTYFTGNDKVGGVYINNDDDNTSLTEIVFDNDYRDNQGIDVENTTTNIAIYTSIPQKCKNNNCYEEIKTDTATYYYCNGYCNTCKAPAKDCKDEDGHDCSEKKKVEIVLQAKNHGIHYGSPADGCKSENCDVTPVTHDIGDVRAKPIKFEKKSLKLYRSSQYYANDGSIIKNIQKVKVIRSQSSKIYSKWYDDTGIYWDYEAMYITEGGDKYYYWLLEDGDCLRGKDNNSYYIDNNEIVESSGVKAKTIFLYKYNEDELYEDIIPNADTTMYTCQGCELEDTIKIYYANPYCPGHVCHYCNGHVDLQMSLVTLYLEGNNNLTKLGLFKEANVIEHTDGIMLKTPSSLDVDESDESNTQDDHRAPDYEMNAEGKETLYTDVDNFKNLKLNDFPLFTDVKVYGGDDKLNGAGIANVGTPSSALYFYNSYESIGKIKDKFLSAMNEADDAFKQTLRDGFKAITGKNFDTAGDDDTPSHYGGNCMQDIVDDLQGTENNNLNELIKRLYAEYEESYNDKFNWCDFNDLSTSVFWNTHVDIGHFKKVYQKFGKKIFFDGWYEYKTGTIDDTDAKNLKYTIEIRQVPGTIEGMMNDVPVQIVTYSDTGQVDKALTVFGEDWFENYGIQFSGSIPQEMDQKTKDLFISTISATNGLSKEKAGFLIGLVTGESKFNTYVFNDNGKDVVCNDNNVNLIYTVFKKLGDYAVLSSEENLQYDEFKNAAGIVTERKPNFAATMRQSRFSKVFTTKPDKTALDSNGQHTGVEKEDDRQIIVEGLKAGDVIGFGDETYVVLYNEIGKIKKKDKDKDKEEAELATIETGNIVCITCSGSSVQKAQVVSISAEALYGPKDANIWIRYADRNYP